MGMQDVRGQALLLDKDGSFIPKTYIMYYIYCSLYVFPQD